MEMRLTGISAPPEGQGFYEPGDCVIIPDVRFQDEADWIQSNGGILIRVQRDGYEGKVGIPGHASEWGFEPINLDRAWTLHNNTTKENLYVGLKHIINQAKFNIEEKKTNGYSESSF